MRKAYCQACNNEKYGIKTRLAVFHTCGKELEPKQPKRLRVEYTKEAIENLGEGSIIKLVGNSRHEYFIREHYRDKWSKKTKVVSIGTNSIQWIEFGTEVNYSGKNFYK